MDREKRTPLVKVTVDWYPFRQEQVIFINHYAIKDGDRMFPDIVARNVGADHYTLTTYPDGKPTTEIVKV